MKQWRSLPERTMNSAKHWWSNPWFAGCMVAIVLFLAALAGAQEDMQVVDNAAFDHPRRPPARFEHDSHNETAGIDDCTECHHVYDEKGKKDEYESSEDRMCADCHATKKSGRMPGLRRAFHLNCKGCHLQQKQGPLSCAQCHFRTPEGFRFGAAKGSQ